MFLKEESPVLEMQTDQATNPDQLGNPHLKLSEEIANLIPEIIKNTLNEKLQNLKVETEEVNQEKRLYLTQAAGEIAHNFITSIITNQEIERLIMIDDEEFSEEDKNQLTQKITDPNSLKRFSRILSKIEESDQQKYQRGFARFVEGLDGIKDERQILKILKLEAGKIFLNGLKALAQSDLVSLLEGIKNQFLISEVIESEVGKILLEKSSENFVKFLQRLDPYFLQPILESENGKILLEKSAADFFEALHKLDNNFLSLFLTSENGKILAENSPEKFAETLEKIEGDAYIGFVLTSDSGKILAERSLEKFFEVLGKIQDGHKRTDNVIDFYLQTTIKEKSLEKFIKAWEMISDSDKNYISDNDIFGYLKSNFTKILAEKSPEEIAEALGKIDDERYISIALQSDSGKILAEKSLEKFVETLGKIEGDAYIGFVLTSDSGKILAEKSPEKFGKALEKIKDQHFISKVELSEAGKIFLSKKPEAKPENPKAEKAEKEDGKTTTGQR